MEFVEKPPKLSAEGSINQNWRDWKQQFTIFLKVSGAEDWSMDRKAYLLLNLIGPVGLQVSESFSEAECKDIDILLKKFDQYFASKVTEAHERYIFFSSARQSTESIDQYVNTLKIRARICNFGDLMESLIRDKIILDVKNKAFRKHLLNESNLDLDEVIDQWKMLEKKEKLNSLCSPKSSPALGIKPEYRPSFNNLQNNAKGEISDCRRCGTRHEIKNCPARGQKCENCGMMNHLAKSCTKPSTKPPTLNNPTKNENTTPKYFNSGPFTKVPIFNKTKVDD